MHTKLAIPFEFYEEYFDELEHFPDRVRAGLKTFLELAGFNPDDKGLLDGCSTHRNWYRKKTIYVYELPEKYFVYWTVDREMFRFITLRKPRVLKINILAIEQK